MMPVRHTANVGAEGKDTYPDLCDDEEMREPQRVACIRTYVRRAGPKHTFRIC